MDMSENLGVRVDKLNAYHYRFGVYTITGIPNAHNSKTSYWISKEGFMVAHYCFSVTNEAEARYQLRGIDGYIEMFEHFLVRIGGYKQ